MTNDIRLAFGHPEERAAASASADPRDRISLRDHIVEADIGAFQQERGKTQRLRFNVVVEVRPHPAPLEDDVDRILSYDTITEAIVLDALSERLDTAMARVLGTEFTEGMYIAAYRTATTREERAQQLDLVEALGVSLCELVTIPLLSMTLTIMKAPAMLAGLGKLHDFLDEGFSTFKRLRKPQDFVATIVGRERQVMERIYAGRKDPFDVL